MFGIGGSVRIYYCPTPINLRKSFDGLAGAVEEYIKQDPESGHVFAFFSRNKKLVKLLQWEDGGFVIWMKRLEQGGFHIPQSADGRIELTSRELAAILSGIKPQRYYKRYSKKLTALEFEEVSGIFSLWYYRKLQHLTKPGKLFGSKLRKSKNSAMSWHGSNARCSVPKRNIIFQRITPHRFFPKRYLQNHRKKSPRLR